ncbi:PoNe immunity protein domain-containing protein [Burkholderia sp. 22PA0106]|uniref:PoNe immunity protein domain-containing protein n=1 Tax=Burkholderia sp. 22PA0106 TaxID=3237371 RepID=UPI0039C3149D
MDNFETRRRQRFLSEQYYDWLLPQLTDDIEYWKNNDSPNGSTESERKALAAMLGATGTYNRFLLEYTAGRSVGELREMLPSLIDTLVHYTALHRQAKQDSGMPPLMFGEIGDYEWAVQLIGLCHLLHRTDLLPQISGMLDPFYRAQDTLYEDLLAYSMDDRYDVDKWFHEKPYRLLINSLYRDSEEESTADIASYLDAWYPAMRAASWHDSHLTANQTEGGAYVGYWAVEAAAAAFLLELDDSSFRDHLLYPKDLVDFARSYTSTAMPAPVDDGVLKIRTGQRCPQSGIWRPVGHRVPGVRVEEGQAMPEVFAPDQRGAYRMQPSVWEYERPV